MNHEPVIIALELRIEELKRKYQAEKARADAAEERERISQTKHLGVNQMNCPDCTSELVEKSTGYRCLGCGEVYQQMTIEDIKPDRVRRS
ncbi:hypothetical protein [Paenibacillus larvae]|uniref:Uncharacterized protein n=1 Tax=Paenibacillus larvae subsp. larvae TaxID=147375 RepID=A0A2L1U7B0_9BACL|nr:hypothetical protein [Paenibacillus larvae]AVF28810.1 hypothetical protein ERICIII_04806 [Paenibacillus larvae subsp. larvae]MCY9499071.1 hypothetical protein [Paenibacillus larvae]MCY9745360.1 hypothetical protein [Paenibacillus larvae]MCY9750208.1 hypothetical protein [Paenibacillus larvae]MDR5608825.1 hypothetical protein [Paenibacillus larvae]